MIRGNTPNPVITQPVRAEGLPNQEKAIICSACNNTWFEEVEIKQFDNMAPVTIGQKIPTVHFTKFYVLRCIKCGELLEPNIMYTSMDSVRKAYDKLVTELGTHLPEPK